MSRFTLVYIFGIVCISLTPTAAFAKKAKKPTVLVVCKAKPGAGKLARQVAKLIKKIKRPHWRKLLYKGPGVQLSFSHHERSGRRSLGWIYTIHHHPHPRRPFLTVQIASADVSGQARQDSTQTMRGAKSDGKASFGEMFPKSDRGSQTGRRYFEFKKGAGMQYCSNWQFSYQQALALTWGRRAWLKQREKSRRQRELRRKRLEARRRRAAAERKRHRRLAAERKARAKRAARAERRRVTKMWARIGRMSSDKP